jgi:hypothetical protein
MPSGATLIEHTFSPPNDKWGFLGRAEMESIWRPPRQAADLASPPQLRELAIPAVDTAYVGVANPNGIRQHGFKRRLEVVGRVWDNAKHLRGGGLLLQRLGEVVGALAQLIEQPRVLDGDDCLSGEVRDQSDLLIGDGRRV